MRHYFGSSASHSGGNGGDGGDGGSVTPGEEEVGELRVVGLSVTPSSMDLSTPLPEFVAISGIVADMDGDFDYKLVDGPVGVSIDIPNLYDLPDPDVGSIDIQEDGTFNMVVPTPVFKDLALKYQLYFPGNLQDYHQSVEVSITGRYISNSSDLGMSDTLTILAADVDNNARVDSLEVSPSAFDVKAGQPVAYQVIGRVVNDDGEPVSNEDIVITTVSIAREIRSTSTMTSDSSGYFEFSRVMVASHPDYMHFGASTVVNHQAGIVERVAVLPIVVNATTYEECVANPSWGICHDGYNGPG